MYFEDILLSLFIVIVIISTYAFRYDPQRLQYDLDYDIPKPSKLLIAILAILMLIFYSLTIIFAYQLI